MFIKKIEIENFRLLQNVSIDLEMGSTLLVGKNNCGKTSIMDLLKAVIINDKSSKLTFNDYPIPLRKQLYNDILSIISGREEYDKIYTAFKLPKIRFYIDYSYENEDEDDDLGTLSPFIIDIDEDSSEVIIEAEYCFNYIESEFRNLFIKEDTEETIKQKIEDNFLSFLQLNIFSIHPNDNQIKGKMEYADFRELFPFYEISAERALDESDNISNKKTPLKSLIELIFHNELDISLQNNEKEIEKLKTICSDLKVKSQQEINLSLSEIVKKALPFGYPNAEELQLTAKTNIDLENQIKTSTNLFYSSLNNNEDLPDSYNGLGYKNLIKIVLKLYDFSNKIKLQQAVSLPIVYIEEPEAHMHPQMQQHFISYLDDFCNKLLENKFNIQILITSHSSHIVNSADFSKIRYIKKNKYDVEIKNLLNFNNNCNLVPDDLSFLHKYLTLSRCDLFFCDKAILIEGTAERLLIPDIIEKLTDPETKEHIKLFSQYYALIEVGGAYAHIFIPLLEFLDIPSLIITDIDSVRKDRTKCAVSEGEETSNATINYWFKNILNKKAYTFNDIKTLDSSNKSKKLIHIEYQVEENSLCGRSLEESIINVNRKIYNVPENPKESDIDFNTSKFGSKTDFAFKLIFTYKVFSVPKYIQDGLVWLSNINN